MKTLKFFFVAILLTAVILPGCKKYPDGPSLSLRSRAARVANVWKVESATENGSDITSLLSGYTETYVKNGDYSFVFGSVNGSGKWAFQNNDAEIKVNGVSNQSSRTLTILRLKEKEFWYKFTDNGDTYEYHLIPN
ncbi:MAG TPA: hypothetical protein VFJ43_06405 [Bacteroidia bacterium]|nr:hypothetical protein [Bacteroidia bacterium]